MQLGGYTKQFEILDEGVHNAILATVQDLGLVESSFDGREQHKVRFVWLTDENDSDGRPFVVFQRLTNSMHEKATLRKTIKGIIGKDPGDGPFDDKALIGAQCQIVITHNESQGRTYANVTAVTKQKDASVKVTVPEDWEPPVVKNYKEADSDFPLN